jgi:hypothetical protein
MPGLTAKSPEWSPGGVRASLQRAPYMLRNNRKSSRSHDVRPNLTGSEGAALTAGLQTQYDFSVHCVIGISGYVSTIRMLIQDV